MAAFDIDKDFDTDSNTDEEGDEIDIEVKRISKKIRLHHELIPAEANLWRAEFARVLSNDYTLTQEQLLTSDNSWLQRIKYNSGIYEEKMDDFKNTIQNKPYASVEDFLEAVVSFFDIEELYHADVL
jgi:hypothetical protein